MANSGDYTAVKNIWYKQDGDIVRTPLRPLAINLDAYPYPDYLDNVRLGRKPRFCFTL